jgi:hypothetical protein
MVSRLRRWVSPYGRPPLRLVTPHAGVHQQRGVRPRRRDLQPLHERESSCLLADIAWHGELVGGWTADGGRWTVDVLGEVGRARCCLRGTRPEEEEGERGESTRSWVVVVVPIVVVVLLDGDGGRSVAHTPPIRRPHRSL